MEYGNIARAVEFYRKRGYAYVQDAPWNVSRDAYYATKPTGASDVTIADGTIGADWRPVTRYAVASGEQSFIQMLLDGQPLKRALCVTPCYRIERWDDWRRPYFMKAELINAHDVDEGHLIHMVHDACAFFEEFLPAVRIVKTQAGYDIVEKVTRVELGSYGIRERVVGGMRLEWIYGTACAEPRLSTVVQRQLRDTEGL